MMRLGGFAQDVYVINGIDVINTPTDPIYTVPAPGLLDAFDRQRVSEPTILFSTMSAYDLSPLAWQTMTSGGGNGAAWDTTLRAVVLTIAAAGYVIRQTYDHIPYQPGRSHYITLTGIVGAAVANVTKRLGQFDSENGLFFELTPAGVKNVVVRNNGADVPVAQSAWNLDPLDGSGASGVTIDWTKDQIYIIDYAWLGVARVRFGFYLNGVVTYCHAMHFANAQAASFMQTAFLPMRWELLASGAAAATMAQICTAIATEGGVYEPRGYVFAAGRAVAAAISTASEVPLLAIRPIITFGTLSNRVQITPLHLDIFAAAGAVGWRLLYYPPGAVDPITGGAWAAPNANSAVEANAGGTALSLTGAIELSSGYVAAGNTGVAAAAIQNVLSVFVNAPLTLDAAGAGDPRTTNVGANPAYMVVSGLGAGATAGARLSWQEIR